jgi:anti-sigma B factor antagonist
VRQIARVEVETHGSVPVARIDGEIDLSNASAIGERLRGLLTNRSEALVVDLGPTTYLDSSGITLLFGLGEELRRRQQELHVILPDASPVRRVAGIAGLDQAVSTHATLEAALAVAT